MGSLMGRLRNLDALRAVAVLAVFAFHLQTHVPALGWPAKFGWVGVDLFFVISGLVICASLARIERDHGPAWPAHFARHRVFRIYPAYVLACVVFALSEPSFLAQPAAAVVFQTVTHALMMHWISPDTFQGLLWVSWSLAIEAQFYVLMWLAWPVVKRAHPLAIVAACLAISIAWHWTFRTIWDDPGSYLLSQLPGRMHEFGWGIAAYKIVSDPPAWLRRAAPGLIVLGAAAFSAWAAGVAGQLAAGAFIRDAIGSVGGVLYIGAACGAVVFGAAMIGGEISRTAGAIGAVSYGVYLWHTIVITALARAGYDGLALVAVSLAMTLAIAAASWRYFELPLVSSAREVSSPTPRPASRRGDTLRADRAGTLFQPQD